MSSTKNNPDRCGSAPWFMTRIVPIVLVGVALSVLGCNDATKPLAPADRTSESTALEVENPAGESTGDNRNSGSTATGDSVAGESSAGAVSADSETATTDPMSDPSDEVVASLPVDELPSPAGSGVAEKGTFLDLDLFPYDSIVSGGPPKDGIPALTNPHFVRPSLAAYLSDRDLVLGVVINGEARAYPLNIGWWHEIVNDKIGGRPISVTFCPLTGTGLVFDARDEDGSQFQLGVSGLLFNTNLIAYDRRDGSTLYPQMTFKAVSGPRRGESLKLLPVVETTWATWKKLYPQTRVIEKGLYETEAYINYPYGDYRTNHQFLLFDLVTPLRLNNNPAASEFLAKEPVLGVRLDGEPMAYPFSAMGARAVINDQVGGVDIVVLWDRDSYLAIPYARSVQGRILSFEPVEVEVFPYVGMRDRETGTLWDVRGLAIEGELAGQQLVQVPAHRSMWFAWVTFWQETGVWKMSDG